MDEARIREIVREEIEAASKISVLISIRLDGETFSRKQVLALIDQVNAAVRDGARIHIRPE